MSKKNGWIGVDLDGTLAVYEGGWKGHTEIGRPIPRMVTRVQRWLDRGFEVKVFTARMAEPDPDKLSEAVGAIQAWCKEHIGVYLDITNAKDFGMIELWDDRAVGVVENTGEIADVTEDDYVAVERWESRDTQ